MHGLVRSFGDSLKKMDLKKMDYTKPELDASGIWTLLKLEE